MKLWSGALVVAAGLGLIAAAGVILFLFRPAQPVWLIGIIGVLLMLVPLAWSGGVRGWLRQAGVGIGLLVVGAIALEILLRLTGRAGLSADDMARMTITEFDCTNGCLRPAELVGSSNPDPNSTSPEQRHLFINAQRLYVEQDYDPALLNDSDFRILASGDSFTVGYTAEIGRSYIETLDRLVPNTTVWNVAYPGTGMPHIVASLTHWAEIMQPDLLVFGLNANDLSDIYPMGRFVEVWLRSEVQWVSQYRLDETLTPTRINETQIRLRYFNIDLPYADDTTVTLLRSALVLSVHNLWRNIDPVLPEWRREGMDEVARAFNERYLAEIGALADRLGIPVMAVHIPTLVQYVTPDWFLDSARAQGIIVLDPQPLLIEDDYRNADPTDTHWNSAGHEKAGELLAACVQFLIDTGESCPEAIVASPN